MILEKSSIPKNHLIIAIILLALTACDKDELPISALNENISSIYQGVDVEFNSYVDDFIIEAEKRGIVVEIEGRNITIQFTDIKQGSNPNVVGLCTYDNHNLNDITIDRNYWNSASKLEREFVLFHELGHCYLKRAHRNDTFSNGICRSIMRGGAELTCLDAYNQQNREYYIDELFSIQGNR